jgi:addiction module RelE/StbE family toxin
MKIFYSSKFEREYKKLPRKIQDLAEKKEHIFRNNPFDGRLGTHKLHGRLKSLWAFWIDRRYRIIFEFAEKNIIWFHSVGDHSMYEK